MVAYETSEAEIREFLNKRILRNKDIDSTMIIEELGLDHGANRIDLAVLHSSIHGFEIKSSRDTLKRLPKQLSSYTATLEKLTLVVASNHLDSVMAIIPDWSGVVLVEKGIRGGLNFQTIRKSIRNPEIDLFRMAHLLWKNEATELLNEYGFEGIPKSATRTQLYQMIADNVSLTKLRNYIKQCFVSREFWRANSV